MPQSVGNVCSPRFYLVSAKRACGEVSLLQNYTGSRPQPQIDEMHRCVPCRRLPGGGRVRRTGCDGQRQRYSENGLLTIRLRVLRPVTFRRACAHT
jgi:hypothetical protein